MMAVVPCRFCGVGIRRDLKLPKRGRYFCSNDCTHGATLKPTKAACLKCGLGFWTLKPHGHKYCPLCVDIFLKA